MKVSQIYLFPLLALTACGGVDNFNVTCEIPTKYEVEDSTWAYICTYEAGTRDRVYTDSALVINNKVTIEGSIVGSEVRRFEVGYKSRLYANFILENGNINIDIENRNAHGTPLNDAMALYISHADSIEKLAGDRYEAVVKDSTLSADDKNESLATIISDYNSESLTIAHQAVGANKDNALGRFVFWQYIAYNEGMTPDAYKQELASAGEYIATFGPVKALTKRYEALAATQPGTDFVDFTIPHGNLDGTEAKLSDYVGKGKLILVDMWASWCPPCRAAMPYIREVYEKYAGEKFDVISVAVWDERQKSIDAIPQLGMTWNQIVEAESIPTELYGVNGIPHLMLIGADGKIIARGLSDNVLDLWVSSELKKME